MARINEWRSKNLKGIGNLIKFFNYPKRKYSNVISVFSLAHFNRNFFYYEYTIFLLNALFSIQQNHFSSEIHLEIFSKDLQADVEKVLKNTLLNQPQMENTFQIDLTKQPPWQAFDKLQCKLHKLSMFPEEIKSSDVNEIGSEIRECISVHVLPDSMCKTIGVMMVHFLLLLGK